MSIDLPSPEALATLGPTDAAAFWLERLQHEADDAETARFEAWLAAAEANQRAWDLALDLWDSFDDFEDAPPELAEMRREALTLRSRRPIPVWAPYAAAASVAIVASAVVLMNLGGTGGSPPNPQVAEGPDLGRLGQVDYKTAVGERSTIKLADGSALTLDTDSAVDVAYLPDKRLVRLVRGQAYFDVTHNAMRPFRVAAGERVVSVLGTKFNVRVADSETRILLVQGSVGVSKGADPARPGPETARLAPGQQLVAQAGQPDKVSAAAVDPQLEWQKGFVQFDGQTLAAAVEELNRYSARKLVVRDPKVAALRISGAFPTGDPERFIETLTALYPVRVVRLADGGLEIVRRR